jgi:hypothetical protein
MLTWHLHGGTEENHEKPCFRIAGQKLPPEYVSYICGMLHNARQGVCLDFAVLEIV